MHHTLPGRGEFAVTGTLYTIEAALCRALVVIFRPRAARDREREWQREQQIQE